MVFIYLDEAGDLGFDFTKSKTSDYFIVCLLVLENDQIRKEFFQAIKKTIKNKVNRNKKNKNSQAELKGAFSPIAVKRYFLRHLPATGWSLYSIALDKKQAIMFLPPKKPKIKFYNYLVGLLLKKVGFDEQKQLVRLILDKCRNAKEISECDSYLDNYIKPELNTHHLKITHENSQKNYGLQAVDLFCWGLARKYNNQDTDWYDDFKDKIQFEDVYKPE